jgi:hypothetical protein
VAAEHISQGSLFSTDFLQESIARVADWQRITDAEIDSLAADLRAIPGSRQNPKILWVDDAEVVGDRIAKALPVFGDFFA